MKFKADWKSRCRKKYEQGKSVKQIATYLWRKRKRSEWLAWGVANKNELIDYLFYAIPCWEVEHKTEHKE